MLVFALLPLVLQAADTWTSMAELPTVALEPVGVWFDNSALVCAGDGTRNCYIISDVFGNWSLTLTNTSHDRGRMIANNDSVFYSSDDSSVAETFSFDQQWTSAATMNVSRSGHSVTRSRASFFMLCGGRSNGVCLSTCEICQSDACYLMSKALPGPLAEHRSVDLPPAKIADFFETVFVGGFNDSGATSATYLYDSVTDSFRASQSMHIARFGHTLNLFPDFSHASLLIVVGGMNNDGVLDSAELWAEEQWFFSKATMSVARYAHTANWLSAYTLIVVGGVDNSQQATDSVEMFDSSSETWTTLTPMKFARGYHVALRDDSARVIVVAGSGSNNTTLSAVEFYSPGPPVNPPPPAVVCSPPAYVYLGGRCGCAVGYVGSVVYKDLLALGCGKGTYQDTSVVVYLNKSLTINASRGVQVNVTPDPAYGGGKTVVVTTSPANNSTVSTIVSIVFLDENSTVTNITGLRNRVRFRIPLEPGAVDPVGVCLGVVPGVVYPLCHWLDPLTQVWSTTGCETNLSATYIDCSCSHLTDFAALIPKYNRLVVNEALYLNAATIVRYPVGLSAVGVVLVGFMVLLLISIRRDLHVASAKKPKKRRKDITFWKRYKYELRSRHSLGAFLWWRKGGSSFTSVDRVFIIFFTVFFLMTMSALFHAPGQTFVGSAAAISYCSLAVVLPYLLCSYVLTHTDTEHLSHQSHDPELPQHSPLRYSAMTPTYFVAGSLRVRFPECCRWIWYMLILLSVAVMMWYILTEALLFDQNPHYYCQGQAGLAWVLDFVLQYSITIAVTEPLILLIASSFKHCAFLKSARTRHDSDDLELDLKSRTSTDLLTIDFSSLEIVGALGKGVFGKVDQCVWRGADCAVKRLLNVSAEWEFMHEVAISRHVNPYKHQNVVTFLGVTANPPGMLLELFPLRSVEEHIIRKQLLLGENELCDMLTILITASAGVSHLHANGVIHRDIAARNFLIRMDMCVSICDFGLALLLSPGMEGSRTMEERKRDMLPVNTSAPETLVRGEYSEKSDVFMFSLFIWELFARRTPHADQPDLTTARNLPAFVAKVHAGLRPRIPNSWPVEVRSLLQLCWAQNPSNRPNINEVNSKLREFRKAVEQQKIRWSPATAQQGVDAFNEANYYDFCTFSDSDLSPPCSEEHKHQAP